MNLAQSVKRRSTFFPVFADVSYQYIIAFNFLNSKTYSIVTSRYYSRSHLFPIKNTTTSGEHYNRTSLSHVSKFSKLIALFIE